MINPLIYPNSLCRHSFSKKWTKIPEISFFATTILNHSTTYAYLHRIHLDILRGSCYTSNLNKRHQCMKYMMNRQNQSMMHNSYHISYTVPGQLRYQQNIPLHIDKHMYWKHTKTQVLSITCLNWSQKLYCILTCTLRLSSRISSLWWCMERVPMVYEFIFKLK